MGPPEGKLSQNNENRQRAEGGVQLWNEIQIRRAGITTSIARIAAVGGPTTEGG